MMRRRQRDGVLILLVALTSGLPGCATLGQSPGNCRRPPEPTPTVRTGGQFAVARIIPIPPEGLPLSDAVESALRPGIITPSPGATYGVAPVSEPVSKVAESNKTIVESMLQIDDLTGDEEQDEAQLEKTAEEIVAKIKLPPATDKSAMDKLTKDIFEALKAAKNDGAFPDAISSNVEANEAIHARKVKLVEEIQAAISAIPNVPVPAAPPVVTPSVHASIVDQLAVVLSRVGGRRIVIPLQMVRSSFPGDIRLVDGDRIDIMKFDQTAAAQPPNAGATATVAVTSWSANQGLIVPLGGKTLPSVQQLVDELERQPSDVVILRRSGLAGVEEYLLAPSDARRLSEVYLQDSDLVHFDVLAMTPLIRDSQAQLGNLVKPPQGPCASSPNGFLGLKGLDRQFKTFTGLSAADSAGQTQRGLQSLGSLVSSGTP